MMITCAHVVQGAVKIEAHFGSKMREAKVIAYDADHDLAVLKVEGQDMPCLPIANSDRVQLAQEIRVVGYPLSNMLGESIKMSRGTVSGISKIGGDSRFQIDATVNPGNSGGPMVDEQGRVVGIASELLTSAEIDSVGFCIPSNEAMDLLRTKNIGVAVAADGPTFAGPELAKRVTPAVALLKVETGPGGVATFKKHKLAFTGSCGLGAFSLDHSRDSGVLIVDACGKVISSDSDQMVPFLFESVGTMGIEELPGDSRETWKSSRFIALRSSSKVTSERPIPFDYHRPPSYDRRFRSPSLPTPPSLPTLPSRRSPYSRYGPPGRGYVETEVVSYTPAIEEVEFKRVSQTDGRVSISKQYQLQSVSKNDDGTPVILMKTQGTITWDKDLQCVSTGEMRGQITFSRTNITMRVPLTCKFEVTKVVPKKVEPTTPPAHPASRSDLAAGSGSQPSVRSIPPPGDQKSSSLETAPASTGLSKFNPND
jgi:hypothetical protein